MLTNAATAAKAAGAAMSAFAAAALFLADEYAEDVGFRGVGEENEEEKEEKW
jgi:hypothetical protein